MIKRISYAFIFISILMGFIVHDPYRYFPLFSWSLFNPLPNRIELFDFKLANSDLDSFKNRFPPHLGRADRKAWLRIAKDYSIAIKRKEEAKKTKLVKKLIELLEKKGMSDFCPISVVKYTFDPIKLYKEGIMDGVTPYQIYPCHK